MRQDAAWNEPEICMNNNQKKKSRQLLNQRNFLKIYLKRKLTVFQFQL